MVEPAVILIVEDQPDFAAALALTCEGAGHQVLTATDGQRALEVLQQHRVDLIVSDIAMQGMNGYQLYQRVRAEPAWLLIPFLFLTARGMDSDIRYGKELGVDDYLSKPIDPDDLLAALHGKLARAQQLRRSVTLASPASSSAALPAGQLIIDPQQRRVWLAGKPVTLAAREFTLLEYLQRNRERVVLLEELVRVTHNLETDRDEASTLLRPLIRSIRRKLGYGVGETGCIENVRSIGYRLIDPAEAA